MQFRKLLRRVVLLLCMVVSAVSLCLSIYVKSSNLSWHWVWQSVVSDGLLSAVLYEDALELNLKHSFQPETEPAALHSVHIRHIDARNNKCKDVPQGRARDNCVAIEWRRAFLDAIYGWNEDLEFAVFTGYCDECVTLPPPEGGTGLSISYDVIVFAFRICFPGWLLD